VTVMNGSNKPRNSPFFNDNGLVRVYRLDGTRLTHAADAKVGHWCQGALFSRDGRTLLVQCMVEKEIQVLGFDGKELKPAGTIKTEAGPAGIRSAER